MVTSLARRRVQKLAREAVTLDHSAGCGAGGLGRCRCSALGVDLSAPMIDRARELAQPSYG
ncbi:MAG TPA: class I SAM-dependent methyltransferase [Actinomycetes bacterium]|jgi:predicted TPR repeat methyltransferase|nr:class I SAM-dependent methyltransferase [Actinomycetes bacterium]